MRPTILIILLLETMCSALMAKSCTNAADVTHADGICVVTDSIHLSADGAYHIRNTVNLGGRNITLAPNATLKFEGGSIDNGTLQGSNNKVEADSTTQVFGDRLRLTGTWNVSARPEWFGARGDGIAYYDRPLRCFARPIGSVSVSKASCPVTVSHPSSRIVNKEHWAFTPTHTTDDVYLDTVGHRFLLLEKGIYYARWANSQEWNDSKSGQARTDRVYSDLSTRRTTVSINGRMVDIDSTMTDNALAFSRAMAMGRGNMTLRPVVYYLLTTKEGHTSHVPWKGFDGFHLKGNGATIFVRSVKTGDPYKSTMVTWGWFYQCRHGVIEHLNLRALRDRDDGAPRGLFRFDSGDSRIVAFGINGCEDITLRDINLKGMSHDFIIKRGVNNSGDSRDIRIDGWKSEQFTQNVFAGVRNIHINNAHLTQAPLIGSGMHIIYGQPYLRGLYVTNSTFRQGDEHTTVMLTYHGGAGDPAKCPDSIFYDNCIIEGARMIQGGGGQHQTFTNCTFRQTYNQILVKGQLVDNKYAIIGNHINLTFNNCQFELRKSGLMSTDAKGGPQLQLLMRNCKVEAASVKLPLIIRPGQIEIEGCAFRCGGQLFSKGSSVPKIKNSRLNGERMPNR